MMSTNRPFKAKLKRQQKIKSSRISRKSVLKMLSVMSSPAENSTQEAATDISQDFLTTGRTGRRNALPDILGSHNTTSTADLPSRLEGLSTSDGGESSTSCGSKLQEPSSSNQSLSTPCSSNDRGGTSSS
ncbi:unnamed protein product [Bemisia tabaci]|uniref:Uncharacterized protein n=1 Tax=Bemisia tabaci TaxID=7038 RepID=A0A9P0AL65_BEMTA|nr:unnamed protein product [Bemisia tabaci]